MDLERKKDHLPDTESVVSELQKAQEKAAILEKVCRFTVASHYEETNLIDVEHSIVRSLLENQEHSKNAFRSCEYNYDEGIRKLLEENSEMQETQDLLTTLLLENLVPILQKEGSYKIRCRIREGETGCTWKQVECAFFGEGEQSILMLVSDVQEEEHVKEQLRETAEEAKAASRAKSAFLANMSHEIRTPMNAIVGISEVLLRKELPRDVLNSISTIQNSGSSLLSIINDILDFSKIETGKFEITEVEYMLPSLLMDISNVISVRLTEKPVYFMMDIDPALPNHFIGDDIRVKQILMNLLGNSVKFTHEGFIELKVWGTPLKDGRFELAFDVKDSGIGIKEEDLGKLFATFTQVDTRKNRATTGSGLGLAISRNLAQLMGGDLTVTSTYGRGSVFSVRIIQSVPRYVPLGEVKDKNVHILVCEQNESVVRSLSRTMEHLKLPYEVCREIDRIRDYPGMTHILIRRKNFEKIQEKLKFMFDHDKILLILDNDEQAEGSFMDYKQLQLPLITLQIINALNGEEIVRSMKRKNFDRSQIVPLTFARILVVDDNTTNLQVAQGLMAPYRMKIDVTTSGFEAIEMVKKTRYHAIFMDHMMPEMDGIETARYIRGLEGEYYSQVPIIALTANAMSDARDLFLESGMNDFVAKPIEMRELHRVIKKFVQSQAPEGYLEAARKEMAAGEEKTKGAESAQGAGEGQKGKASEKKGLSGEGLQSLVEGGVLEQLLIQNNQLLSQNMLLLKAIFGEPVQENWPSGTESGTDRGGASTKKTDCAQETKAAEKEAVMTEDACEEEVRDFIHGVDMQKSIEAYGGSVAIYHNILKTYYSDIREKEVTLKELFENKDIENFTIQVHAVKSASRGVGAFDLGDAAYELELAGKAGDWPKIEEAFPHFYEELCKMAENVGTYVEKYLLPQKTAKKETTDAFDPELVEKLREACGQMDYLEAESILQKLNEKRYPKNLSAELEAMLDSCSAFDYDRLEELVGKL